MKLSHFSRLAYLAAAAVLAWMPVRAAETVYDYHIEHPRYGTIGTYKNTIETTGDRSVIQTELHVAVKLLGIVVHREDGTRVEQWQGNRLMRFDSVTDTNGEVIRVHGEATGDRFAVTTPDGVVTAPADVHPSNPWSAKVLDTDTVMSTKSGQIEKVSVAGGDLSPVMFDGKQMLLKRFDIVGAERQAVWLDDKDVPVAFRTVQDGDPIDFVMTGPPLHLAEGSPQIH